MKILMIAPEPFFTPRGTPFSEYYRTKCLIELGHEVDIVTYPIGEDVELPGMRIFRAPRIPGITKIKIGPSLVKLPLDFLLFFKAWQLLETGDYDAIHSHEEAGIMAVFFSRLYNLPHVYDMHSSLPDQLDTFKFSNSRILKAAFDWMEDTVLAASDSVIAICPALVDKARERVPETNVTLIENTAESHQVDNVAESELKKLKNELGLQDKKIILYIGTFETYQGLGLLMEACKTVFQEEKDAVLLMVGGSPEQVEATKREANEMGIGAQCRFTGMVPHNQVPGFLKAADVLVSPRRFGTNTPLKVYSYLRSGTPVVATDLYTHTQVLNPEVAQLTEATAEAFAKGILRVLGDRELGKEMAEKAFQLSEQEYSYNKYSEKTRLVYHHITQVIKDV